MNHVSCLICKILHDWEGVDAFATKTLTATLSMSGNRNRMRQRLASTAAEHRNRISKLSAYPFERKAGIVAGGFLLDCICVIKIESHICLLK